MPAATSPEKASTAQRIVSLGDANHILVSKCVADTLSQFGNWATCLHDLGEHELAPSSRTQLFNLYTSEFGNPAKPESLGSTPEKTPAKPPAKSHDVSPAAAKRSAKLYVITGVAILALAGVVAGYIILNPAPPM